VETGTASELVPAFAPETELERALASDPELVAGLRWGKPRKGHPEGSVAAHVDDLLRRLEDSPDRGERRSMLRIIILVHDSLKYRVRDWLPKRGENHHAMLARRFAERYTQDERILSAIELHDRPYAIWRRMKRTGRLDERAFEEMMRRLPDPDLFLRFVELDQSAEGKNPEPIRWFREELSRRRAAHPPSAARHD
jgi:HD domain-containing protein